MHLLFNQILLGVFEEVGGWPFGTFHTVKGMVGMTHAGHHRTAVLRIYKGRRTYECIDCVYESLYCVDSINYELLSYTCSCGSEIFPFGCIL